MRPLVHGVLLGENLRNRICLGLAMKLLAIALLVVAPAWGQLHTRLTFGQTSAVWPRPSAVARVGDVNADGLPDLVVGAVRTAPGQAGILVVSGSNGAVIRSTTIVPNSTDAKVKAIAGLSDVDGDGVADYAVGMPYLPSSAPYHAGVVYVYSGASGAVLRTIVGSSTGDLFGWSLCAIGDVDGDGVGDLVAGAPQGDTLQLSSMVATGYVRVISGATGSTIRTIVGVGAPDFLGSSVTRLGDVDGDGVEDLAAGAPELTLVTDNTPITPPISGGYVRAFSGASGAVLYTISLTGLNPAFLINGGLGFSLTTIGDANGDGIADFASGAILQNGVFIFSGSTGGLMTTLSGPQFGAQFGLSIAGAGDLNGDGIPDLVVGAPGYSALAPIVPGVGRVAVYSGTGALLASYVGSTPLGQVGLAVAGLGDQNGDGFPEVGICSSLEAGFAGGSIRIGGLAVADVFGQASGPYPLTLAWNHTQGSSGAVILSGASAGPGVLVASIAPSATTVAGVPVVVDLLPGHFLAIPIAIPATGVASTLVDLRQPGLVGATFWLQGAMFPAASPPLVSNGLALSFAP